MAEAVPPNDVNAVEGREDIMGKQETANHEGHIRLCNFDAKTRTVLSKFDDNQDGHIDAQEIQAVVNTLVSEKFKSKAFKIGLIILGVFTVILLAAMFGLTWAVVAALKDTEVQGTTLVDKSTGVTLQVANVDMTLDAKGQMVSRGSNAIVATAAYQGALNIDWYTPFQALTRLTNLKLHNPSTGAEVMVSVLGVARVRSTSSPSGWAVKVHTTSGLIVIDATAYVEGGDNSLLQDAGFSPKNGTAGRHLLQSSVTLSGTTSGPTGSQAAYDSCSGTATNFLGSCSDMAKSCYGSAPTSDQWNRFFKNNYACLDGSCPGNWKADGNKACAKGYGALVESMSACC